MKKKTRVGGGGPKQMKPVKGMKSMFSFFKKP